MSFFLLTQQVGLFCGNLTDNAKHSHHAIQLAIGLDSSFTITAGTQIEKTRFSIISSNQEHELDGGSTKILLILAEPFSKYGRFIENLNPLSPVDQDRFIDSYNAYISRRENFYPDHKLVNFIFTLLGMTGDMTYEIDPRIQPILYLPSEKLETKITIKELTELCNLSESRLQHLFKEKTGIPITQYLLWKRIQLSIDIAIKQGDLTFSAVESGFSDSAHMSRTFKKMFGLTPSKILKNSRSVQVFSDLIS